MIGSLLTRGLVMVFGFAYPAYECFKSIEMNKPDIDQLRFWCQYWILVAGLTVCERIGDTFISWVPMYSEAKLAFFIYLWYPKTKGTTYVYDSFFRPYIAKHEAEIDRNLSELSIRAEDIAVLYWRNAANYSRTRISEILQFTASQSTQKPRSFQPPKSPPKEKPSPKPSKLSSELREVANEASPRKASMVGSPKPTSKQNVEEKIKSLSSNDAEAMEIKSVSSSFTKKKVNPPKQEIVVEETIRVTRGRLRKSRALLAR